MTVKTCLLAPFVLCIASTCLFADEQNNTSIETNEAAVMSDLHIAKPKLSASCERSSKLPNLIGMDITVGREVMFENGYRPIMNEDISSSWESKYFPGISELMGCSNGVPWCIFNYENDAGVAILRTLGNQEIVEQEVICNVDKAE